MIRNSSWKESQRKTIKDVNIMKGLEVENRHEGMHRTQDGVEKSKHT